VPSRGRALSLICHWYPLRRRLGLGKDVVVHSFRHSYASIAASDLGFGEFIVAGLLAHSAGTVTSRYVHHHVDRALLGAADAVSDHIWALMQGSAAEQAEAAD
jgi:integrase